MSMISGSGELGFVEGKEGEVVVVQCYVLCGSATALRLVVGTKELYLMTFMPLVRWHQLVCIVYIRESIQSRYLSGVYHLLDQCTLKHHSQISLSAITLNLTLNQHPQPSLSTITFNIHFHIQSPITIPIAHHPNVNS